VDVSATGAATAAAGGIAVSGYVSSIAITHAGPVVRSAYLEQVRRIAPERVIDREEELAELASFCTEPDRGPYAWWQAAAWAGKSALMSWFVLHPPPGARVVSFFITARFAGQNNRGSFADAVLEQLADLLREPMPGFLTEATRDPHLLGMLAQAAQACRQNGQRLVLVVDGLDEDLGWTTSTDSHSVAALLPVQPPAGMRIIVADRPNPPIPADVPENHPLRSPRVLRLLDPSPHAAVVQFDARREVKRLVTGTEAEQDLLGLLTAAAGGLSGPDLAELTGLPAWRIEEHLHTVSGRTFARQPSRWRPGASPEVYLLGHEELRQLAVRYLETTRLEAYRRRLHAWAERYCQQGWPAGTPEYLLRGYYRLLHVTGDLDRVIACATDQARHDRMLDLTGGDSAALSEITTAQQAILRRPEPDLLAMACLAIHRDNLAQRNANVPVGLPAVWAMLSQPNRAEALADSITNTGLHGEALAELAAAAAIAGDQGRARIIADRAEAAAASLTDSGWQAWGYATAAKAMTAAGDLGRAHDLVGRARDLADQDAGRDVFNDLVRTQIHGAAAAAAYPRSWRTWAITAVVEATVAASDPDRKRILRDQADALAQSSTVRHSSDRVLKALSEMVASAEDRVIARILAGWAEMLTRSITDPGWQARELAALAKSMASAGDTAQARVIASRADAVLRAITDDHWQVGELSGELVVNVDRKVATLADVAEAMAAAGDLDNARNLAGQAATAAAESTANSYRQPQTLIALATATAAAGNLDQAEAFINSSTDPYWHTRGLIALVTATAAAGNLDQVHSLAERVRALAGSITDPGQQARMLAALAAAIAASGDLTQAQAVADSITDPREQAQVLTTLANAMAVTGDFEGASIAAARAQALAGSIIDPGRQALRLAEAARALAAAGDPGRARKLADRAQAVASRITDPGRQALTLAEAAKAMATAGDVDRARAVAYSITDSQSQAGALKDIAEIRAAAEDLDQAETVARCLTDELDRAMALRAVANAAVEAGNLGLAETIAGSIGNEIPQAWALARVVRALVAAGNPDRAETLAGSITWPPQKVEALAEVARAMAMTGKRDQARILFDQAQDLASSRSMIDLHWQAYAFADLIKATAAAGDRLRTRKLIRRAEAVARANTKLDRQADQFSDLAAVVAAAGEPELSGRLFDQADSIAHSITDPGKQGKALAHAAKAMAAGGDLERAQAVAHSITDPSSQARALADVTEGLIAAGELDRAQAVAHSITDPDSQAQALAGVTGGLIAAGEPDRAQAVAQLITIPSRQAETLTTLAKKLAAGNLDRAEAVVNSITDTSLLAKALAALAETIQPERARPLVARAFQAGDWTVPLHALSRVQPIVLAEIADKLLQSVK